MVLHDVDFLDCNPVENLLKSAPWNKPGYFNTGGSTVSKINDVDYALYKAYYHRI